MSKRIILVMATAMLLLMFTACGNDNSQNESEETEVPTVIVSQPAVENEIEEPSYLTKEELLGFELLYGDKTEVEIISVGAVKVSEDEANAESVYKIGNVEYLYMYFSETPVFVTVKGLIDVQGPRGIAVGDSFETVLAKFPQEKDWQRILNGEVYGDQAIDMEAQEPCAMVTSGELNPDTNQPGKRLTVLVKYALPSVSFYFDENDRLTSYRMILTTD